MVLGDQAGLFGKGTSGEGCDITELRLPGVQERLLEARCWTPGGRSSPCFLSGRPYALGEWARPAGRTIVQAFFPGQEGGPAVAGSAGRAGQPVGDGCRSACPRHPGEAARRSYLAAAARPRHRGQHRRPDAAAFPFGHGFVIHEASTGPVSADATAPVCPTDGAASGWR